MCLVTNHGDRLTLTTRLSLFFLGTLAVVLIGFSVTLFVFAKVYLHRQSEERLEAALNTLVAAVEVTPDGVEWEPAERHLSFASSLGAQLEWMISDDQGRIVDRSTGPTSGDLLEEASNSLRARQQATKRLTWQGERWQINQRWIQPPPQGNAPAAIEPPSPAKGERKFPALAITAGVPIEPVRATLRSLGLTLASLSAAIWLMALIVGRMVCRRALLPVARMAESARDMDGTDLAQRLPTTLSGDELEDLSQSFNSLLSRLQESLERQRRFTGDVSHQLRTPLTAILGQIEVALRRDRAADEYRSTLGTVHQRAEHLRKIVESLLFLARTNAEAQPANRERLDLKDWFPKYLDTWADHPRFGDVRLDVANAESVVVEAQTVLLAELLNVLLDNAFKFSQPGTSVAIRFDLIGNFVELTVADQGCGIAEEDQRHLFTPFFRSAESIKIGVDGLGLGLSIAKRLAESFAGALAVTSRVNFGSCFTLRLPAAAVAEVGTHSR